MGPPGRRRRRAGRPPAQVTVVMMFGPPCVTQQHHDDLGIFLLSVSLRVVARYLFIRTRMLPFPLCFLSSPFSVVTRNAVPCYKSHGHRDAQRSGAPAGRRLRGGARGCPSPLPVKNQGWDYTSRHGVCVCTRGACLSTYLLRTF